MCDCGCNTCETKKAVMLNESIAPKEILSEGLKYHMNNNIPLTEHVYRAGSQNYFNLWAEARALYSRGILEVQGDDLEVLTETDLGHFGMFEGKKVPLDFPIEITEAELNEVTRYSGFLRNPEDPDSEPFNPTGAVAEFREELRALFGKFKGDLKNPEFIRGVAEVMVSWKSLLRSQLDEQKEYTKGDFEQMASREFKPGTATDSEIVALARKAFLDYKFGKGFKHHFPKTFNISEAKVNYDFSERELIKVIKLLKNHAGTEIGIIDAFEKALGRKLTDDEIREFKLNEAKTLKNGDKYLGYSASEQIYYVKDSKTGRKVKHTENAMAQLYGIDWKEQIDEAKKKKGPKLNKPMRSSSGGKAYKVYVRDPKTGNIKTVRFGSGGLRAKINDPKARQAFAKRHKCSTKKDKTKASYWSCRLPRYAKLLGLKSSFSGFW